MQDPATLELDLAYDANGVLVEGRDLETAVLISLFTDAAAKPGDDVPPGELRRGFWADVHAPDRDVWGSRLWLLERSKVTRENILRAKEYCDEALAWMVRDQLASAVLVETSRFVLSPETHGYRISVVVVKPDGSRWERVWNLVEGMLV